MYYILLPFDYVGKEKIVELIRSGNRFLESAEVLKLHEEKAQCCQFMKINKRKKLSFVKHCKLFIKQ